MKRPLNLNLSLVEAFMKFDSCVALRQAREYLKLHCPEADVVYNMAEGTCKLMDPGRGRTVSFPRRGPTLRTAPIKGVKAPRKRTRVS